jgi:hypothetical protein
MSRNSWSRLPAEDEASPKESEKVRQELRRRGRRGVMEAGVYGSKYKNVPPFESANWV